MNIVKSTKTAHPFASRLLNSAKNALHAGHRRVRVFSRTPCRRHHSSFTDGSPLCKSLPRHRRAVPARTWIGSRAEAQVSRISGAAAPPPQWHGSCVLRQADALPGERCLQILIHTWRRKCK